MNNKKCPDAIYPVLMTALVLITSLPALAQADKSATEEPSLVPKEVDESGLNHV